MQLPLLTRLEQDALVEAMRRNFGNCTCAQVGPHLARCDGHRFLSETEVFGSDRQQIDRVTRLVMYRRAASFWTGPEFSQPNSRPFVLKPGPMLIPAPLPADLIPTTATPPPSRESPPAGDNTGTLPW